MEGLDAVVRIVEVATAPLIRPLHTPFTTSLRRTTHVTSLAVRVRTADGVEGYGEAPEVWRVTGESVASARACVMGPLADVVLGVEVDDGDIPALHTRLAGSVVGNGGARAALETATVDVLAREHRQPISVYLGGASGSIKTDLTVAADATDESTRRSAHAGFRHLKVKVGLDESDVRRVLDMHDWTGGTVTFRIDANQAWDVERTSAAVAAWLDAGVQLDFIEQPLPRWDIRGHAQLRTHLPVPLMLDESVFSQHDLLRVIDEHAADIVNIKLAKCGGLYAGLELARIAHEAGLQVIVGSMMESELGVSAAAALASVIDADAVHDLDAAWWSTTPHDGAVARYAGDDFVMPRLAGTVEAARTLRLADLSWTTRTSQD